MYINSINFYVSYNRYIVNILKSIFKIKTIDCINTYKYVNLRQINFLSIIFLFLNTLSQHLYILNTGTLYI